MSTPPNDPYGPQPGQPGEKGDRPEGQPYGPPGGGPEGQHRPTYAQGAYSQPSAPLSPQDEKTWAVVAHIGPVVVSFLAPLLVFLIFRGRGPYLEDQSKEALNFQITVAIAYAASGVLAALTFGLLAFLPALVWVAALVFEILAALAASRFEYYRYPLTLRLVK
ncbi:hypothetical protein CLV28_1406 [Sediminihabitans luteus]|uniref:Tic20 family protein n=1 Tax=Sediminihabitans luteus TaxID=1138585 RepID=A0A2M9CPT8_9CELL|nr:DUF4870 domain-containing protein [Sediminihabitans luteus]PJJ73922.1 hypothetical protein CLV28_1406 [Sediminihabitans luteus]GII98165.1 hypothetical protein Slu03_05430 [Sediminihabitans luteus]